MIIRVDPERCCSSGVCVLTAPGVFDQAEDDGSVRLLRREPSLEQEKAVREAVDLCPSQAIALAPRQQ
jgi:ferredoxin